MEITSLLFIIISIVSIFIYYLLENRYRVYFLIILSCGFIATYSYALLFYVLGYALLNYFIGLRIPNSKSKTLWFRAGILLNILQLILLKYLDFTVNPVLELLGVDCNLTVISRIIIPVGVSFFTLQGIGYLINVKMGWEKPEKVFSHLLLYISFFPRFLSGPIDRSNSFLPQLKRKQLFNESKVTEGLRLVVFGLFKKVAIANQLAPMVSSSYANSETLNENSLWIVLLLQPIYLYFDFSGYTDIAFGIAKTFGLELRPNFNRPFMAENMTTFWKRFHISLSSWFHDYIFVRTVFKYRRWKNYASIIALLISWVLFGIWHGAGWNFMLLGFLQAVAIYYEFSTKRLRNRFFSKMPVVLRVWMGRMITYMFYAITLVFFFAEDIHSAFEFFPMLIKAEGITFYGIDKYVFLIVVIFIIFTMSLEVIRNDFQSTSDRITRFWFGNTIRSKFCRWALYLFLITIVIVFNTEVQQFIYFQF